MVAPRKQGILSQTPSSAGILGQPKKGGALSTQAALDALLESLYTKYPAIARHRDTYNVTLGQTTPNDPRQLESYPPWESWNPVPGKATTELFNLNESPQVTENLIAGDMLHYLGAVDPRTNQPVDPTYRQMKLGLLNSLTPEQKAVDQRAYQREAPMYDNPPPFEDWMDFNRGDAYIRGYLTPDAQDQWRNVYTPEQKRALGQIAEYLYRGTKAPGMR